MNGLHFLVCTKYMGVLGYQQVESLLTLFVIRFKS